MWEMRTLHSQAARTGSTKKVVTAIRKFVDEGGGFIGVGEPTACQHQGRYFQLSDVMGVDREMGFSLSTDKYNTCDPHHFILEDIDTAVDFGEGHEPHLRAGQALSDPGAGRRVQPVGRQRVRQGPQRLLCRAALLPAELPHFAARHLLRRRYAGGDEALLRDHVDTEVTVFPETKRIAVINNSEQEQKTDLYIKGKLVEQLTLAPREMRWVEDAE